MYPCNYNWKELKLLDIRTDIQNIKLMVKTEKKKRNKETWWRRMSKKDKNIKEIINMLLGGESWWKVTEERYIKMFGIETKFNSTLNSNGFGFSTFDLPKFIYIPQYYFFSIRVSRHPSLNILSIHSSIIGGGFWPFLAWNHPSTLFFPPFI
jgi:hypothetical protein